mgnify:CR=1 FL=1
MEKIDYGKERQHCREFYGKWDFAKRIVALYAEGVAWRGCKVIALAEPNKIPSQYSQIIDTNAIKNGVRDMLVDGIGDFNLQIQGSPRKLSILMPPQSPLEKAGCPLLWPYIHNNAKTLEDMTNLSVTSQAAAQTMQTLVDDMCRGLGIPHCLLQPLITTAPGVIEQSLTTFRGRVNELRSHIAFHMTEEVEPLISKALNYKGSIEVVWNEEWFPKGIGGYGPVYQAFKAQGIELKTLAQQALDSAQSLYQASVISRETYEETIKWFL